ncbi:hypothetical protein F5148DRAFT_1289581 [Russula earlei]|uniref:Uncharacterized protein n=1 Tax=Russula earlei TaxID=71964 RepID=A0ACC0TYS8_9AGAM|nr:hypothetical protein F5148DRAFT_1289581 [Russula earlei]
MPSALPPPPARVTTQAKMVSGASFISFFFRALLSFSHLSPSHHPFSKKAPHRLLFNLLSPAGPNSPLHLWHYSGDNDDDSGIATARTGEIAHAGRFLRPISADDVLFGNTFDRPLKLPWGSGAALKFMHFVDPTLEHDLASSTKPWALSPLISTMPYFAHRRVSSRISIALALALAHNASACLRRNILHLTLRTPEPSHSPSPSPLSSRHASPSGAATPSDSDGSMPASVRESWFEPQAPGNASSTLQPPKSHVGDKHLSKKHKRLSAASLASRLSAHHEGRLARSERKRTETFAKQEQELQELRNCSSPSLRITMQWP